MASRRLPFNWPVPNGDGVAGRPDMVSPAEGRRARAAAAALTLSALFAAAPARADETIPPPPAKAVEYDESAMRAADAGVRAPKRALEIVVDGGYAQPFGKFERQRAVDGLVGPGGAVEIAMGHRFDPRWSFALSGQFLAASAGETLGDAASVGSAAAMLSTTYHFLPFERFDPFVELGAGYRALWLAPAGVANDETLHGVEPLRVVWGLDFYASPDVALGPQLGCGFDVFPWSDPETGGLRALAHPYPVAFVSAGLGARFDIGGVRIPDPKRASSREALAAAPAR